MTQYMSDFQRKFINRWSYLHCKLDGMNILPYLAISCLEMLHFLFVQGLHGKCLNMPRAQGPVWLFEICTGSKVGIPWNTNVPVRSSKYYINCQYNCKLHWGCYAVLTMLSSYQCYTVQILADIYCDISDCLEFSDMFRLTMLMPTYYQQEAFQTWALLIAPYLSAFHFIPMQTPVFQAMKYTTTTTNWLLLVERYHVVQCILTKRPLHRT